MTQAFNTEQLRQATEYLKHTIQPEDDTLLAKKKRYISMVLNFILSSNDYWLSYCPFSYSFAKENMQSELNKLIRGKTDEIDTDLLLLDCMCFVREAILSLQRKHPAYFQDRLYGSRELDELWTWFIELDETDINKRWHRYFSYVKNELANSIFNYQLGDKSFQAFLNFENNIVDADKKSSEFKQKIQHEIDRAESKIQEVQRLENTLKEQKEGYNFIGLSKGFSDLLKKKENSRKWIFRFLILIGLVIIGVPLINLFCLEIKWAELSWQQMVASIGLEFVLIYYFRITLQHYRSVQTQIMQLELRLSLCQFIQNYAEYAKEMKVNDKEALAKFENLIFSSILSNDNNIPSTFDGMEQITQLIKELKSKS